MTFCRNLKWKYTETFGVSIVSNLSSAKSLHLYNIYFLILTEILQELLIAQKLFPMWGTTNSKRVINLFENIIWSPEIRNSWHTHSRHIHFVLNTIFALQLWHGVLQFEYSLKKLYKSQTKLHRISTTQGYSVFRVPYSKEKWRATLVVSIKLSRKMKYL